MIRAWLKRTVPSLVIDVCKLALLPSRTPLATCTPLCHTLLPVSASVPAPSFTNRPLAVTMPLIENTNPLVSITAPPVPIVKSRAVLKLASVRNRELLSATPIPGAPKALSSAAWIVVLTVGGKTQITNGHPPLW